MCVNLGVCIIGRASQCDFVYDLQRRLITHGAGGIRWHEIYADEVQDLTQAQLHLLLGLAADPNGLFLAGDTAQTIARGIGFRFTDIRTLFHETELRLQKLHRDRRQQHIRVATPQTQQLVHNYRSHTGVLKLAATVCDLIYWRFPGSIDHLPPDQGLLDGPRPLLIEATSHDELSLLLLGNQRATAQIEFGAHQAIIVRNEEARECLPEELQMSAITLTVAEAKGLEVCTRRRGGDACLLTSDMSRCFLASSMMFSYLISLLTRPRIRSGELSTSISAKANSGNDYRVQRRPIGRQPSMLILMR